MRVVDMACGEGYGSAVLAARAAEVTGVDANPDAHEHARLRYSGAGLRFERALIEEWEDGAPWDAIVFLQTIEHVTDPAALLRRFAKLLAPGGVAYVTTPNRLTLAPAGAERSGNPWHVREYTPSEYHDLVAAVFGEVELLGLFHARKLRAHEMALRVGWDRAHAALRITRPFYSRFVPAISERDFELRSEPLHRSLDLLAVCRP
jgi:2-polyprenyl-3-methyl-5-hydroxy-6-metoxy-1,4-benzoquinol methylase